MAKATSYTFQGREWTVKDLAEELGLSTHRVYRLLKDHNEDIKAIFESRGITPKAEDKGQRARLFEYKGKQWTVKQLAEEFGLSYERVNNLIRQYDGDIEKIASSRQKSKKADPTKKAPKAEKTDEKTLTADSTSSQSLILKDQKGKILSEFECKNVVEFWDFIVNNYEKYVDLSKEMFDREYLIVAKKINKDVINLFYINFEFCPGPSDVGHDYDRGLLAESAQICYEGDEEYMIKERTDEELNTALGFDMFEWFE